MNYRNERKWRNLWNPLMDSRYVWSPKYGFGVARQADTFDIKEGANKIFVTYADEAGEPKDGIYYDPHGVCLGDRIYPYAYGIMQEKIESMMRTRKAGKNQNAESYIKKLPDTPQTRSDGLAWLLTLFLFLFCSAGNNGISKPPVRSKEGGAMIRAHKMLGESWKRVAQTMGMTPAQAFVDFSSSDVLLHFVDDIGNVYGVAMEELKRRMENGQYDSEGENHGDGHTDV